MAPGPAWPPKRRRRVRRRHGKLPNVDKWHRKRRKGWIRRLQARAALVNCQDCSMSWKAHHLLKTKKFFPLFYDDTVTWNHSHRPESLHTMKTVQQGFCWLTILSTFYHPSMNSMKFVIPLHFISWKKDSKWCCDTTTPESIHTKDESKRGSAFAFIVGVKLTSTMNVTKWHVSWNSWYTHIPQTYGVPCDVIVYDWKSQYFRHSMALPDKPPAHLYTWLWMSADMCTR